MLGFSQSTDAGAIDEQLDQLGQGVDRLREHASALQSELDGLGETGDALRTLVHRAKNAQFRRNIEPGKVDND